MLYLWELVLRWALISNPKLSRKILWRGWLPCTAHPCVGPGPVQSCLPLPHQSVKDGPALALAPSVHCITVGGSGQWVSCSTPPHCREQWTGSLLLPCVCVCVCVYNRKAPRRHAFPLLLLRIHSA